MRRRILNQRGQASVEMVAAAVLVALLVAAAWYALRVAHTVQSTHSAARSAARAVAVGAPAERAARTALPGSAVRGMKVTRRTDRNGVQWVAVRVRLPAVWWAPGHTKTVSAEVRVAR